MFFNFTIRHYLLNPKQLADDLKASEMRGFWQRVILIFIISFLLFSLRSMSGIHTENLTSLLVDSTADYTLARFGALVGSMIWSILYVAFHLFVFSWVLSFIFDLPFTKLLPMQLLMVAFLLLEKILIFIVFVATGMSTSVSFLSFGPLAATFLEMPFFVYFFNQLTITTAVIIGFQYSFLKSYVGITRKYRLLFILIGLHLLLAIATASVTLIPLEDLLTKIFDGGVAE